MKTPSYDLIGDIHGQHGKLVTLLKRLGYVQNGIGGHRTWRHPDGRKIIFLGDFIDRGPAIREVLFTVRGMVDAGDALAIMGNHEFNAILYHTSDGAGGFMREHNEVTTAEHEKTLASFVDHASEWEGWLAWMKSLPFSLELDNLRAVHACWDQDSLARLQGHSLRDEGFLRLAGTRGTPEFKALKVVLNGPELHLPDGITIKDPEGRKRSKVRVRWWNIAEGMDLGEVVLPVALQAIGHPLRQRHLKRVPNYPDDAPPVFFGHYWMPPDGIKAPLASNVACLDFSAAHGPNSLVAYRWDGEHVLCKEKFA